MSTLRLHLGQYLSLGAAINTDQALASVMDIGYEIADDWDNYVTTSWASATHANRRAKQSEMFHSTTGKVKALADFDGYMGSVTGGNTLLFNEISSSLPSTVNLNFIPTRTASNTIQCFELEHGTFDLQAQQYDGSTKVKLIGNLDNLYFFTSAQTNQSTNYSIANMEVNGTISMPLANSDQYIVLYNVTIASGGSLTIQGTGTGTGTIYVQGVPSGTTLTSVTALREFSATSDTATTRMTAYLESTGALIGSSVSGTSLSINSSDSTNFTAGVQFRIVATKKGYLDYVSPVLTEGTNTERYQSI